MDPLLRMQRMLRFTKQWVLPGLLGLGLLLGGVLWFPQHLSPLPSDCEPDLLHGASVELRTTCNEAVKLRNEQWALLLQALGGAAVLSGAFFAWYQLRTAREGMIIDRYSKVVDHLESDALPVRIGGVHALARIARDSPPHEQRTMARLLCSYVRTAKREGVKPNASDDALNKLEKRAPDVHEALQLLGSWRKELKLALQWQDLHGCDLRYADLRKVRFRDAYFHYAQLHHAEFSDADLRKANFYGADLREASFHGARLRGAELTEAELEGADLCGADLTGAKLEGPELRGACADDYTRWPSKERDRAWAEKLGVRFDAQCPKSGKPGGPVSGVVPGTSPTAKSPSATWDVAGLLLGVALLVVGGLGHSAGGEKPGATRPRA